MSLIDLIDNINKRVDLVNDRCNVTEQAFLKLLDTVQALSEKVKEINHKIEKQEIER